MYNDIIYTFGSVHIFGGDFMKRIVLTGGGTAGHVTPNLALIPELLKDGWDVHYIGAANSAEQELVSGIPGVTFHTVSVGIQPLR